MNKNIICTIGGVIAGIAMTLAAASLIPEDYIDYRKNLF